MRKHILFFIATTLFSMSAAVGVWSQDRSNITVKRSDLSGGVVVVDMVRDGKGYRLVCNEGMPGCTSLKGGKYQIVELPKNFGMYDCKDVEVYPDSASDPQREKRIGEYCLEEK